MLVYGPDVYMQNHIQKSTTFCNITTWCITVRNAPHFIKKPHYYELHKGMPKHHHYVNRFDARPRPWSLALITGPWSMSLGDVPIVPCQGHTYLLCIRYLWRVPTVFFIFIYCWQHFDIWSGRLCCHIKKWYVFILRIWVYTRHY